MANGEKAIQINVNTKGIQEATKKVSGLGKIVQKLSGTFTKVFSPEKIMDYFKSAVQSSGALDKELLVLRLALGKLKAAVGDAVAPLGTVFIPLLQQAVWAATRLVKAVGKVMGALLGYSNVSKETAKAQEALASSGESTKRSLMGFDEINRLDAASTEQPTESTTPASDDTLSPQLQAVVDKILSLAEPLKTIDFSPAVAAFGRLKEAIAPISQTLFAGLEWAWHNLLVPLAAWTIEDLLPAFLDRLSAKMSFFETIIKALQPVADWLWESFLKPIAQWTGEIIIQALQWLADKLGNITDWIQNNKVLIENIIIVLGSFAAAWGLVHGALWLFNGAVSAWNTISAIGAVVTTAFGTAMSVLMSPVTLVIAAIGALIAIVVLLVKNWDTVKATAIQVWEAIKTAWGNAWAWFKDRIIDPLVNGFKGMVNGIIGFLNTMIAGVVSGINGIVGAINKLKFSVPDWVPGLGGKSIGFNLKTVNTPQIPYLAQGAVLPANKPFLAVVGDQHHGTNVEAPLATIQQAVAQVTGEQTSAILAGFASSLEVQREILQAVLGIQIGDELIGNAVSRYRQKMAVVNGGVV